MILRHLPTYQSISLPHSLSLYIYIYIYYTYIYKAGLDEIPPDVWKTRQFDDILFLHCNAVHNQNPVDRWRKGCILPFPKKKKRCSTTQPHGTQN